MKNTIDQCQEAWCACVVIWDPHVDRINELVWLLASLVVSCALKGRRNPFDDSGSKYLSLFCLQEGLCVFICKVCIVDMMLAALRKTPQGDFVNCLIPPASNLPPLICSLQSYCNQCSPLAVCGINVTKINFTIFFSQTPHNSNLSLQSKFMCPRIQFPSHPHKFKIQRLIGIHLVIIVIHPSMNNAIPNLKC